MKGLGTSLLPLISGVRTDIEKLLSRFIEKKKIRFEAFAELFREMKFCLIFRSIEIFTNFDKNKC